MKLLRLEVTHFGKLEHFVLEPEAGLNIYSHPNEFGKTTLIYFIYYMFYGYDTKLVKGYLPWNGSELAGALNFEQGGKEWRIERRRKSTEKRQILCVTTGEELVLAQKEQPGPHFLGLDGATFLRTFCITQGDLLFSRTDGLDMALKNMAATGDENVSFQLAEEWLNKQHTKYMYRGRNQGPLLDKKEAWAAGKVRLEQLRQQLGEQIGCRREWERLEQELPASEERLAQLRLRLQTAEGSDALRLLERLDALKQKKPAEPPAVSKEELEQMEQAFEQVEQTKAAVASVEEEKTRVEDQLQLMNEGVAQYGFHALSGQDLEKLKKKPFPWWILLLVAAVAAGVAGLWLRPLFAVAALLLAVGIAVPLLGQNARKRLCHSYGAANEQQLQEKWEKYQQALSQAEQYKERRQALCTELEQRKAAVEAAVAELDRLRGKTHLFDRNDLRRLRVEWGIYEARQAESPLALQEEALLNGRTREELERLAAGATLQEETAGQVRALLEEEQEHNRSLRDQREALDPRALEELWTRQTEQKAANKVLKYEILADEAQFAAVQTALGWLKEANQEMNTRFAPRLCKLAGEHLARLTNGKYTTLLMDEGYAIRLQSEEGTFPLAQYSAGTRDAVYFSFRLAVSGLLSAETLPMVLDDPFVNLDPARLQEAELLLKNEGERRQILYFKCR